MFGALTDRNYVDFRVEDGEIIELARSVPRPYLHGDAPLFRADELMERAATSRLICENGLSQFYELFTRDDPSPADAQTLAQAILAEARPRGLSTAKVLGALSHKEPCADEQKQLELADAELLKTEAVKHAQLILEIRLKAAAGACALGAAASLTGLAGLIGGGATCIATLIIADEAAADYEHALELDDIATSQHFNALVAEFLCLSACSPHRPAES